MSDTRTYDPNLDNVYVNRDGTIRWDGEPIGFVGKVPGTLAPAGAKWRAEIGDPSQPAMWPRFRAIYAQTRAAAVAGVLEGVEVSA